MSIYYSEDAGDDYALVASGQANDSLYQWTAPSVNSDSCLIRVVAYDHALLTGEDVGDSLFSIMETSGVEDGVPRYVNMLNQNYPNPFNPSTRITFSLAQPSSVTLAIYDITGHLVRVLMHENKQPGGYSVVWDGKGARGRRVASGVYLQACGGSYTDNTKKMILLK